MKDFHNLFTRELSNIYNAESHLVKTLPGVINAAHSSELKQTLTRQLEEAKKQVERLEEIAESLDEPLTKGENPIAKALVNEVTHVGNTDYDNMTKDAAIILAIQHVKHYEISCYGTLKAFAKHLKFHQAEKLFDASVKEEGSANNQLTEIAEGKLAINDKASRLCA